MKKIIALSVGDLKNITRDALLLMSILAPILLILVWKWGIPFLAEIIRSKLGFDLTQHYSFVMSFFALLTPMMLGILAGFIILDERDERILTFFAVTPLGKAGYLFYRLGSPVVLSFIFSFCGMLVIGLVDFSAVKSLPVHLMSALEAPLMALFLAVFAKNKVEGMALSKAIGVTFFAPFIGYLVKGPIQLLGGIVPPYWVTQAFLASLTPGGAYWFYILLGTFFHVMLIFILLKRFKKIGF